MKYYRVIDTQGANFMDYSHDVPMTANEIRSVRWCDYKDNFMNDPENNMRWQDFIIDFVCDFWEINLEEVKK